MADIIGGIKSGITGGIDLVSDGISSGIDLVSNGISGGISSGIDLVSNGISDGISSGIDLVSGGISGGINLVSDGLDFITSVPTKLGTFAIDTITNTDLGRMGLRLAGTMGITGLALFAFDKTKSLTSDVPFLSTNLVTGNLLSLGENVFKTANGALLKVAGEDDNVTAKAILDSKGWSDIFGSDLPGAVNNGDGFNTDKIAEQLQQASTSSDAEKAATTSDSQISSYLSTNDLKQIIQASNGQAAGNAEAHLPGFSFSADGSIDFSATDANGKATSQDGQVTIEGQTARFGSRDVSGTMIDGRFQINQADNTSLTGSADGNREYSINGQVAYGQNSNGTRDFTFEKAIVTVEGDKVTIKDKLGKVLMTTSMSEVSNLVAVRQGTAIRSFEDAGAVGAQMERLDAGSGKQILYAKNVIGITEGNSGIFISPSGEAHAVYEGRLGIRRSIDGKFFIYENGQPREITEDAIPEGAREFIKQAVQALKELKETGHTQIGNTLVSQVNGVVTATVTDQNRQEYRS